jgi:peroxiredoxin
MRARAARLHSPAMAAVSSTMLELGTEAPPFELPDPGGQVHRLDDSAGAPALLVAFLCNHCPYVRHIGPQLGVVTERLMRRGVAVVGVNSNDIEAYPQDGPAHMRATADEFGWRFPYLFDESQSVARAYHAACTPDFFLFDADGVLVYRGQFDDSRPRNDVEVTGFDLERATEAVLAGSRPSEEQRPSMGCNIKWKPGNEPAWFA